MPALRYCLDCGAPVHPRARYDYCSECKKGICYRCGCRLPRGKGFCLCTDCTRAKRERTLSVPGRLCYVCGTSPPTPRSQVCSDCHHADYLENRRLLRSIRRRCGTCREWMERGRFAYHCPACQKEQRSQLGRGKPCAHCRERPRYKTRSYCHPCWLMLGTLWRSARRGDATARRLVRARPRMKWV